MEGFVAAEILIDGLTTEQQLDTGHFQPLKLERPDGLTSPHSQRRFLSNAQPAPADYVDSTSMDVEANRCSCEWRPRQDFRQYSLQPEISVVELSLQGAALLAQPAVDARIVKQLPDGGDV